MTRVDLVAGEEAREILRAPAFIASWISLLERCDHATAFQAPCFVTSWYECYAQRWQPVVVRSIDPDGELVGLWLLAHGDRGRQLVHAGAHQAEYHAWLAVPGTDQSFVSAAWKLLLKHLPFAFLRFAYLPKASLASDLTKALGDDWRTTVIPRPRPLQQLNAAEISASFAKKSNKSRVNRLKRLGELKFERLTDPLQVAEVFDELTTFYDFRQGAVNGTTPFREDPSKRQFCIRAFTAAPQQHCVSVTRLDGRPIAGFWGMISAPVAHLGMLMYSPFLAEHSPGKLHMMQLADHLVGSGLSRIDLTPGGDAWKERFANEHDNVAEVLVHRAHWRAARERFISELVSAARNVVRLLGSSPNRIRAAVASLRRARPSSILRRAREWVRVNREFRVYSVDKEAKVGAECKDLSIHCNDLRDLLEFLPGESWQTRDVFLSNALARLEQGERVYTVVVDGQLAHYGWMVLNQSRSHMSEVDQSIDFPPGSFTLYDFYTHPRFRGKGLYRRTLNHMLDQAFACQGCERVFISVLADNLPSRRVIESAGFRFHQAFFLKRSFGVEERWAGSATAAIEANGA